MFLRDVLKRWNVRPVDAANGDGGDAGACATTPSLLAELATDPEDFADLARVLNVDLSAVVRAIVTAQPSTIAALVAQLSVAAALAAPTGPAASEVHQTQASWGSGGAAGWGRWTRAHGGVRVHRQAPTTAARAALATP